MRLKDKVALITGAGRGIGRGIALRYAMEGARIAIADLRDDTNSRQTLAMVKDAGSDGCVLAADVSDVAAVRALVEQAVDRLGRIDVLINNAGIERAAPFWAVEEADYQRVLDVNLKGAFFAAQAFVRHLRREKRGGRIINISSVHEQLPFPGFASYAASKGGMKMMMRTLAIELAPLGITVKNIAPGAIGTAMNASLADEPALLRQIPLHRLGTPADVAGAAVFLASADADYITGSTLTVDGGLLWDYSEKHGDAPPGA